jgi:predicted Zn-dependent peptidase
VTAPLTAAAIAVVAGAANAVDPAMPVVLDTSPRVALLPEPGAGFVTSQWLFDAGSTTDPAAEQGAAHLVEHLSFGPLDADGAADFDARLGALGGVSDGWTDRERAGLGAVVPSGAHAAEALLGLELQRAATLVITEDGVARQRAVIAEELAEAADAAHGPDRTWLSRLLWAGGEPWSRHPQSPPNETTTAATAAARWRALVQAGVLVLAGEFDAEPVAARLRARLPARPPPAPAPAPTLGEPGCEPAAPATRWARGNGRRGSVYVAWPVPGRDHRDRVALEALARWVGGARIAVGAGCGEWVAERAGAWHELPHHRASLLRAIGQVAARGLDPGSVARVRDDARADLARALASLPVRARVVGACLLGGRTPDCIDGERAAWDALTGEDVGRAAARWLPIEATTTLAVLPPATRFAPWIPGIRAWSPE